MRYGLHLNLGSKFLSFWEAETSGRGQITEGLKIEGREQGKLGQRETADQEWYGQEAGVSSSSSEIIRAKLGRGPEEEER